MCANSLWRKSDVRKDARVQVASCSARYAACLNWLQRNPSHQFPSSCARWYPFGLCWPKNRSGFLKLTERDQNKTGYNRWTIQKRAIDTRDCLLASWVNNRALKNYQKQQSRGRWRTSARKELLLPGHLHVVASCPLRTPSVKPDCWCYRMDWATRANCPLNCNSGGRHQARHNSLGAGLPECAIYHSLHDSILQL